MAAAASRPADRWRRSRWVQEQARAQAQGQRVRELGRRSSLVYALAEQPRAPRAQLALAAPC